MNMGCNKSSILIGESKSFRFPGKNSELILHPIVPLPERKIPVYTDLAIVIGNLHLKNLEVA